MNHPEHPAKTPSPRTGFFATLRGLLPAKGSGAPSSRRRPFLAAALTLAALIILGAATAIADTAPTPTIAAPTSVEYTTAHLSGTVDPNAGPSIAHWHFEYSTDQLNWSQAPDHELSQSESEESTPIAVAEDLALGTLQPNTAYFIRLAASNDGGQNFSAEEELTTKAVAAPTVTIEAPAGASATTAHFSGHVNPGSPEPEASTSPAEAEAFKTAWHFECNPACPGLSGELQADDTAHAVTALATGLTPGTPYEVTLIAENKGGSASAGPEPFATLVAPPAIDATFATDVITTEAAIHAQVDPGGAPTTVHFEYITQEQLERNEEEGEEGFTGAEATPESFPIGSDNADHQASANLTGLTAGTVYNYRTVAANAQSPVGGTPGPVKAFTTYASLTPETDCPNQAFRAGPSAFLPDCRAYEMVSPVNKNGGDVTTLCNIACYRTALDQASLDGDKFTYSSYKAFADAASSPYSSQYLATRSANGWSTDAVSPPRGRTLFPFGDAGWDLDVQFKAFSEDLSKAWVTDDSTTPLTPDGVEGEVNLYQRDNGGNSYEAVTTEAPTVANGDTGHDLQVEGSSADGSHMVFSAGAALTPDAAQTTNHQLYDYSGGKTHLVSILPDGEANGGDSYLGAHVSEGGGRLSMVSNAVSDDGSRIFWDSYVRENPAEPQSALNGSGECTEPAKACTIPFSAGAAQFWTASTDGSTAIYTEGGTLYKFDVESETATPVAGGLAGVLGASDNASSIYFVSGEVLAPGATAGQPNLYLDHEGAKTFIATLSPADISGGPNPNPGNGPGSNVISTLPLEHASRVSADGSSVAFESISSLTGYDNTDTANGEPDLEVYVYQADAHHLTCVSCRPSGARPKGQPMQKPFRADDEPTGLSAAAWLTTYERGMYPARDLSANGNRVFFNAFDTLLPQDNNGAQDVYEWEADDEGTCTKAEGCLSLISSGESPQKSEFVDASADSRDVFFTTASGLLPQDPGLIDIYDARETGGFPAPFNPGAACEGEACQTPPAAPNDPTPSTSSHNGPGNLLEGRPKKHHRNRKHHKRSHRRNGHDHRGQR